MAGYGSSPLQYTDVESFLDLAYQAERGVRKRFPSRGAATHFRARCNAFKRLDRDRNRKLLTPIDPLYGACIYDELVINLVEVEGEWALEARKRERVDKTQVEVL